MKDRLGYWLYLAISAVLIRLPTRVAFALGAFGGRLAYLLAGNYRRLVLRNLAIAFGTEMTAEERRKVARDHFAGLGANLMASVGFARLSREGVRALVEVEGLEHVRQAVTEKRGFVMVISHLGSWELLAQVAPHCFQCEIGTVYQRLGNPLIDAEVRATRARLGVRLFERKEGFQGALQLLRAGGGVGVLMDQHAGDGGVWCPFFNRLASTTSLGGMLALRTGAALLPCAVYTDGPGRWKMVILPAVPVEVRDPEWVSARLNQVLEKQIRANPSDWFWVHNRWKTPKPKFLLSTYKRGVIVPPGIKLRPFRVAIRSSNWLGDAVMSVPAVRAINGGRPDLHLTVVAPAKLADFWRTVAEVDEVIALPAGENPWAVARRLRARFEAVVLFPNSLRVALEVWLADVPRRVGYPGHRRRWLLNQVWKEKKQKDPRPPRHQVHHYLELAKFIGAEIPKEVRVPVRAAIPGEGTLRIGLCPGAEYGPAKRWLPERFREVMAAVEAEWVIFGVAKDAPIAEEILQGFSGKVENRVGQTSLAELIEELKGCAALLTNDTGTMHLAAHLGVPVVAIFGSTEPALTGPLGSASRVVRHHVECSPCFLRECPIDFRCMKAVKVADVVKELCEVLGLPVPAMVPETVAASSEEVSGS